jgi:hypothetical protein
MPKGYGYDEAPKKASGFKMKGYAYAGSSPVKDATPPPTPSFMDSVKSSAGAAVGSALVEGVLNLGFNALKPKEKEDNKTTNVAGNFSKMKIV